MYFNDKNLGEFCVSAFIKASTEIYLYPSNLKIMLPTCF